MLFSVNNKKNYYGITVLISNYDELSDCILNNIYRSRKEIFIDRKKWAVESYLGGDLESDEFDDSEAYYIYTLHHNSITGCVRLRPSTSPTLLTGPLKKLKKENIEEVKSEKTWEASRFFITPNSTLREIKGSADTRTYILFISMIEFGMAIGILKYEVVVDSMMMRILRMCGWPLYILNSDLGSLGEKIYYGTLSCSYQSLNNIVLTKKNKEL